MSVRMVPSSFQAATVIAASIATCGGALEVKSPMTEIPQVPVLKPSAWAPTTLSVMPPWRASKTWP